MKLAPKSLYEGVKRYFDNRLESQWKRNITAWFSKFRRAWVFTGFN